MCNQPQGGDQKSGSIGIDVTGLGRGYNPGAGVKYHRGHCDPQQEALWQEVQPLLILYCGEGLG